MLIAEPRLFGPSGYYQAIARADECIISTSPYNKRHKEAHRYTIIDNRQVIGLTVPLGKPHGAQAPTWDDCPVSTHDRWWEKHRAALETAYGRTPYFEFIFEKFSPVFRSPEQWPAWPSAIDLIREANRAVCEILAISTPITYKNAGAVTAPVSALPEKPYWQVRQHLFGFVPGLSVLDIIFNLGPEAAIHLNTCPKIQ